MKSAKEIEIKLIHKRDADMVVKKYHYSGKVTQNSQINFGIFDKSLLIGALQFGPSIDKRRMAQSLGIGFNDFLELNRMALIPDTPKNTESRAISICLRILKKQYPNLKCIISFADACQCGDGTIYRASGFVLNDIKKNKSLLVNDNGDVVADKTFNDIILPNGKRATSLLKESVIAKKSLDNILDSSDRYLSSIGKWKPLEGYQFKYIYCYDQDLKIKLDKIPFDKIPNECKMYLGKSYAAKA